MITMAITPGPNTILSLANSSQKGIRKGIYLNYGMLLGIAAVDTIVYFPLYYLEEYVPYITPLFQIVGIIYMIYIGVRLLTKGEIAFSEGVGDFKKGFLMQLINMKVMLLCISAISMYILPMDTGIFKGYLISLIIPVVCFICGLVWALFGSFLKGTYKKHGKLMNAIFAISLFLLALKGIYDLVISFIH